MRYRLTGLLGILTLSGAVAFAAPAPVSPVTAIGPAVSCVPLRNIRSTKVIDDTTIDFHMAGKQVFRNTLPLACPRLGFERAFTYQTSNSQLCSVDIITVLMQGGGMTRGASCGLGKFTPIATPAGK